jgi:dTDP-4-amino-4,6-dideoxygalactose transaminase
MKAYNARWIITVTISPTTFDHVIPVANPGAGNARLRSEILSAIAFVIDSGRYVLGEQVSAFEQEFASWVGVNHGIGVGNGTDALVLALQAVGVKAGDQVILPSHSAVATAAAIEMIGAIPVFADIDPDSRCLSPVSASAMVTPQTRAVVVVHIYGHPADMSAFRTLADSNGISLIEDCAQAHGAAINDQRVGTFGDIAAFSFYPTKNLGAIGDGGAVLTNDAVLAARVRELREYGWRERYISHVPGRNTRLDELQAAILRVKLPHLAVDNQRRREIAARYTAAVGNAVSISAPGVGDGCLHAMHLYVLEADDRAGLMQHLAEAGIGCALHYPQPIHAQPAYAARLRAALPYTERLYQRLLSLPMYPELIDDDVERVCVALREWIQLHG